MTTFIVWVGGVADYEGNCDREARRVRDYWLSLGYEDVILQSIKGVM